MDRTDVVCAVAALALLLGLDAAGVISGPLSMIRNDEHVPAPSAVLPPRTIYGDPSIPPVGAPYSTIDPHASVGHPGTRTTCTAKEVDQTTGRWICTRYAIVYPQDTTAPAY